MPVRWQQESLHRSVCTPRNRSQMSRFLSLPHQLLPMCG
jgi:hypothetical protein